MKTIITEFITEYVREYQSNENISTKWGVPIVGFADAKHPYIINLKKVISHSHQLPIDVLEDAKTVIVYFVPFTKELAMTNFLSKDCSSVEWAVAYEETNAMFMKLNERLITKLNESGYRAGISNESLMFDRSALKSNWSHRHFAYAAGIGTFGINNMLITKSGGCGRYSSLVTNLNIEHGSPMTEELCLYKRNKSCGICVKHCPNKALTLEGYEREKCNEILQKNAQLYKNFGSSYSDEKGKPNSIGSEVCGKCAVNIPCAFW